MHRFFKNSFKTLVLFCGISFQYFTISAQDLKLATPQCNLMKGIIQEKPLKLYFDFRMDNAEIRYTTDGTSPTLKSKKYIDTIEVKKPCVIKAKAFHPSFEPSSEVITTFIKGGKEYASVTINQSNPRYKADGSWTINNNRLGNNDYNKEYLGYEGEPIIVDVAFDKKVKTKEVVVSLLINQNGWIFGPSTVIITDEKGNMVQHQNITTSIQKQENNFAFITVPCKGKYQKLRIIIDPIDVIPTWHEGKGGKPWLFVDEVIVR
jgi:Chitobiase/beta-hexosaminidase C-terminal domain